MLTAAVFFLFFFQLLTGLVETTYAFGLLGTNIPPEIASILLMFTPLALLFFRRVPRWVVILAGELVLACRVVSVLFDTRGKMLISGAGVGAFLIFFPALLWLYGRKADKTAAFRLGAGLALAALASVGLHALYYGNDISDYGIYRLINLGLAVTAGIYLPRQVPTLAAASEAPVVSPALKTHSTWRMAGLCLGLFSVFGLLYFGVTTPTVIARWTGGNYLLITALAAGVLAVGIIQGVGRPALWKKLSPTVLLVWNLIFVAALALILQSNQVAFPQAASGFPLSESSSGPLAGAALMVMVLLSPVLLVDFIRLAQALIAAAPSMRALAGGFSLAVFYLLLMTFGQVFTTVYDYIPVVGPWFRDRFWLVFLAAGVVLVATLWLVRASEAEPGVYLKKWEQTAAAGGATLLAVLAVSAVILLQARPGPAPEKTTLRILTFNIQQGYSASGQKNFAGQLQAIRQLNPDLIGLQESDTARVANGNSDEVRFLADQLDMLAYYGPKTVTGTFGIALLSRYPIENPQTFFMYSVGEQTAALTVPIRVGQKTFNVLVTHLGNDGPLIQQQQVLERLAGWADVIAMGDFNFRPDTDQYRLTLQSYEDAWTVASKQTMAPGQTPEEQIDHIFLSPGMQVSSAEVLAPGPSDHPLLVVDIRW